MNSAIQTWDDHLLCGYQHAQAIAPVTSMIASLPLPPNRIKTRVHTDTSTSASVQPPLSQLVRSTRPHSRHSIPSPKRSGRCGRRYLFPLLSVAAPRDHGAIFRSHLSMATCSSQETKRKKLEYFMPCRLRT